jgi:hypothetical protein
MFREKTKLVFNHRCTQQWEKGLSFEKLANTNSIKHGKRGPPDFLRTRIDSYS